MPKPLDFHKAKVQAIISVLENTTPKEREGRVGAHLVEEFNALLQEVGNAIPEAAPHLPKRIPMRPQFSHAGISPIGYVDLMIMAAQVLRVLGVIESHG
jgi:hypothetical protein